MSTLVSPTIDDAARNLVAESQAILQLQRKVNDLTARAERAEAALAACQAESIGYRRYVHGVLANPAFSPAAKLIELALPDIYNGSPERKDQPRVKPGCPRAGLGSDAALDPAPMYRGQVAKMIGMGDAAAGDAVNRELVPAGAVVKTQHYGKDGKLYTALAPSMALLVNPRSLKMPEGQERRHGGRRVQVCKACGSENIVELKKWVCDNCGEIHTQFEPQPVNPPSEAETPPAPAPEPGPRPHDGILDLATRRGKGTPRPEREPAPEPAPAPVQDPWGLRDALVALVSHTGDAPPVLPPVPGWTVEVTPRTPETKTREYVARKLRDGYHEGRPTPEECEHLPNLVTRLANGDLFCADCGGRNDQLVKGA